MHREMLIVFWGCYMAGKLSTATRRSLKASSTFPISDALEKAPAMWTAEDRETDKVNGRRYPSDLPDAEQKTLHSVLSGDDPLSVGLCEMVNACLYRSAAGCEPFNLGADTLAIAVNHRFD